MTIIKEYLRGVAEEDPMTREKERELLAAVRQKGTDCEEMGRLEKAHTWLISSLLPQYQRQGRTNEELIEAGKEGLRRAALQYTPEADEYFYRFAVPFIREQMQRR